ncbi:hypothetical protein L9F63_008202, partial [Diploptera punctata]
QMQNGQHNYSCKQRYPVLLYRFFSSDGRHTKMSSLNFMELCRLCLVKERVSIPIFEGEGDVRQILLKIAACLPVKVARDDKLPKKICDECMYKLDNAYQFWNTTANAEKQLLQWLGDVTNEDRKNVPSVTNEDRKNIPSVANEDRKNIPSVANEDRKNIPSNTIETEQLVLKEETIDQETPEVSKHLNRVEEVMDDDERVISDDEDTESEEEGSNSEDSGDDDPPGKEEEQEQQRRQLQQHLHPVVTCVVSFWVCKMQYINCSIKEKGYE